MTASSTATWRSTRRASAASGCVACCASRALASAGRSTRRRTRLRDAARELSDLRDADALLETYDKLGERFADEVDLRRIAPVRRALVARRRRLAEAMTRSKDASPPSAPSSTPPAPGWRPGRLRKAASTSWRPGLERAYQRGRKAMRAAYDAPSSERFHDWRKRVKYHRYHLDLLGELWPRPLKARRKEVKALGTMLGDEHDLAVLRATLAADDASFADASTRALLDLAARRRAELRAAMRPLGGRLFAERPKALAARYGSYWRSWRSEAADDRWADVA